MRNVSPAGRERGGAVAESRAEQDEASAEPAAGQPRVLEPLLVRQTAGGEERQDGGGVGD